MNIVYNNKHLTSTHLEILKEEALKIAEIMGSGIKIELNAICKQERKNCDVSLTIRG